MSNRFFDLEQELSQAKEAAQQGFSEARSVSADPSRNRLFSLAQHLEQVRSDITESLGLVPMGQQFGDYDPVLDEDYSGMAVQMGLVIGIIVLNNSPLEQFLIEINKYTESYHLVDKNHPINKLLSQEKRTELSNKIFSVKIPSDPNSNVCMFKITDVRNTVYYLLWDIGMKWLEIHEHSLPEPKKPQQPQLTPVNVVQSSPSVDNNNDNNNNNSNNNNDTSTSRHVPPWFLLGDLNSDLVDVNTVLSILNDPSTNIRSNQRSADGVILIQDSKTGGGYALKSIRITPESVWFEQFLLNKIMQISVPETIFISDQHPAVQAILAGKIPLKGYSTNVVNIWKLEKRNIFMLSKLIPVISLADLYEPGITSENLKNALTNTTVWNGFGRHKVSDWLLNDHDRSWSPVVRNCFILCNGSSGKPEETVGLDLSPAVLPMLWDEPLVGRPGGWLRRLLVKRKILQSETDSQGLKTWQHQTKKQSFTLQDVNNEQAITPLEILEICIGQKVEGELPMRGRAYTTSLYDKTDETETIPLYVLFGPSKDDTDKIYVKEWNDFINFLIKDAAVELADSLPDMDSSQKQAHRVARQQFREILGQVYGQKLISNLAIRSRSAYVQGIEEGLNLLQKNYAAIVGVAEQRCRPKPMSRLEHRINPDVFKIRLSYLVLRHKMPQLSHDMTLNMLAADPNQLPKGDQETINILKVVKVSLDTLIPRSRATGRGRGDLPKYNKN